MNDYLPVMFESRIKHKCHVCGLVGINVERVRLGMFGDLQYLCPVCICRRLCQLSEVEERQFL